MYPYLDPWNTLLAKTLEQGPKRQPESRSVLTLETNLRILLL